MKKKTERIKLTDEQLKVLDTLGINLRGKELSVGILAGKIPFIKEFEQEVEDIIICVSGC